KGLRLGRPGREDLGFVDKDLAPKEVQRLGISPVFELLKEMIDFIPVAVGQGLAPLAEQVVFPRDGVPPREESAAGKESHDQSNEEDAPTRSNHDGVALTANRGSFILEISPPVVKPSCFVGWATSCYQPDVRTSGRKA